MSEQRPDKCGHCSKACTLHYTQVIDGKVVKVSMCAACPLAADLQTGEAIDHMAKLSKAALVVPAVTVSSEACPACGFTREHFKESGRLGCPKCYEFYRESLAPILANLHQSSVHKGKIPRRRRGLAFTDRIAALKEELRERIAREEFEEAATLRDRINELEKT